MSAETDMGATGTLPLLPRTAGRPARRRRASWGVNATLLTIATVVLSAGNYAYSFVIVHLLGAREFARFSAAQGLLLVIGSGCMAAIPWAMARFITERDSRVARREAIHFGLWASVLQGVVAAVIAGAVLWITAGVAVGVMTAIGTFAISLVAVPVGFLQGIDRIRAMAGIRVLEFLVRVGSALVVVIVISRSASAALIGYPIGSVALIAAGLYLARSGLPPIRGESDTIRVLVRQSLNLGAIQVFLSMLGALDGVAALAAHLGTVATASYQGAALLGRIPLFLSTAISLAVYTHLVTPRRDADLRDRVGQALSMYMAATVPFLIACLTVPDSVIHTLLPASYVDAAPLLRFTAVSGAAVGWINVVSTAHQARSRFRPAIRILGVAAFCQPLVLICAGRVGGLWVFAAALAAVSVTAAVFLSFDARLWIPVRLGLWTPLLGAGVVAAALVARASAAAWVCLIAIIGLAGLRAVWSGLHDDAHGAGGRPL
jgi:O-antigen/teichoic acid export membrane protein